MKKLLAFTGKIMLIGILFFNFSCSTYMSPNEKEESNETKWSFNRKYSIPIVFQNIGAKYIQKDPDKPDKTATIILRNSCSMCYYQEITLSKDGVTLKKSYVSTSGAMRLEHEIKLSTLDFGEHNYDVKVFVKQGASSRYYSTRTYNTKIKLIVNPFLIKLENIDEAIVQDDHFVQKNFQNDYRFSISSKTDIMKMEFYINHRLEKTQATSGTYRDFRITFDGRGYAPEAQTLSIVAYDSNGVTGLKEIYVIPKIPLTTSELSPIYYSAFANTSINVDLPLGYNLGDKTHSDANAWVYKIMRCTGFDAPSTCNAADLTKIPHSIHLRILDQYKEPFYNSSDRDGREDVEYRVKLHMMNYEAGLMARQMLALGVKRNFIDDWHHKLYDTKESSTKTVHHRLRYNGQDLYFPYTVYKEKWYEDMWVQAAIMYLKAGVFAYFGGPWAAAKSLIVDMATISGLCDKMGIDPLYLSLALTLGKMGWNYYTTSGMTPPPAKPNYTGTDKVKIRVGAARCSAPGYKQLGFEHSQTEIGGKVYEHGNFIQNTANAQGPWNPSNRILMEFYVSPSEAQAMIAAMNEINNIPLTNLNLYGLEGICHSVTNAGLKEVGRSLLTNPPNGYFAGATIFGY